MLITVNAVTGIEYINPEQITHVAPMRESVIIHFSDQSMVVMMQADWDKIKAVIIGAPTRLQQNYDDALQAVFNQQRRIEELESMLDDGEASPAADDGLDDDGLPF